MKNCIAIFYMESASGGRRMKLLLLLLDAASVLSGCSSASVVLVFTGESRSGHWSATTDHSLCWQLTVLWCNQMQPSALRNAKRQCQTSMYTCKNQRFAVWQKYQSSVFFRVSAGNAHFFHSMKWNATKHIVQCQEAMLNFHVYMQKVSGSQYDEDTKAQCYSGVVF